MMNEAFQRALPPAIVVAVAALVVLILSMAIPR